MGLQSQDFNLVAEAWGKGSGLESREMADQTMLPWNICAHLLNMTWDRWYDFDSVHITLNPIAPSSRHYQLDLYSIYFVLLFSTPVCP